MVVKALYAVGAIHDAAGKIDHRLPKRAECTVQLSGRLQLADTSQGIANETLFLERRPKTGTSWTALATVTTLQANWVASDYASEEEFKGAVEEVVGRKVIAFISGLDTRQDVSAELFYFEPRD